MSIEQPPQWTPPPVRSQVAPGWYPDPSGVARWWDGYQWGPQSAPIQQPAMPHYGRGTYVSDKSGKNVQAIIAWVLAVLTAFYMLPWAIAATRGKANSGAIGWLNLLIGWTIVGWIAALVMACQSHRIA